MVSNFEMSANRPQTQPCPEPAEHYRTVLLFGAPGAGKGTVGKMLGSIPGFLHCACGDVFRDLDSTSDLGQEFLHYSSQGLLVPDNATIALWCRTIGGMVALGKFSPTRDRLVLDGIPRNSAQADIMDDYITVERIFYLICSDERMMVDRLKRRALKENRLDDASDTVIRRRLEVYEEETHPVLDHYPAHLVTKVEAANPPIQVLYDILGYLLPK